MKNLSIDIETYSSINLAKSGVYRYCESGDFEILLFAYSIDGGEVVVVDIARGEELPRNVVEALSDDTITKWAFNAQFERTCLSKFIGQQLPPNSWRCTMVWAATLGLPLSLEGVGAVLGLEKQKLAEGKDLIRFFCNPYNLKDGTPARHLPKDNIEKWLRFKAYNKRDVEVEMAIQKRLSGFPASDREWENYMLDQEINDRGIMLDMDFVDMAIECNTQMRCEQMEAAKEITGLENPNSTTQLKAWLEEQGLEISSLSKEAVNALLENATDDVAEMLNLRQQLAKSSVTKYKAMKQVVCSDSRARGLIQFYGANRTGRYAGRLIQVQNLPQNHLPDLEDARAFVKNGQFADVDMLYESVPKVLSELIRTAFVPKEGHRFFVADFAAIEARVIAWLAGEDWRQDVFKNGGDIYCASASQMFKVPVEKHGINSHLRQKGKIAELALGYGGSVGVLKAMGALQMGIAEEELKPLVDAWRSSNKRIVSLWYAVNDAVLDCVKNGRNTIAYGIGFELKKGILFIHLPSGRKLAYVKPRIGENRFGGESVTYEGVGGTKKWERIESYGAKFVENIIQATSRDILAEAMLRLNAAGYRIVMHVHDEVVIEAPADTSIDEINAIMGRTPAWAEGLLLRADGYVCDFYRKD